MHSKGGRCHQFWCRRRNVHCRHSGLYCLHCSAINSDTLHTELIVTQSKEISLSLENLFLCRHLKFSLVWLNDYFDLFPFETLNIFVSVDMKYFFETEEKTFGGFSAARINICFSPSPLFVATTSISPPIDI